MQVLLCRKKDTRHLFAVKALDKHKMRSADVDYVLSESEALQEIKHPFIMRMHGAFQVGMIASFRRFPLASLLWPS